MCVFWAFFIGRSCIDLLFLLQITRLTAAGNNAGNGGGGTYRINKLQTEIREIQTQLKHSEEARHTLEITLDNVKDGKVSVTM